jgi:hypothetical protein
MPFIPSEILPSCSTEAGLEFITEFTVIMPALFKIKQGEEQNDGKPRNAKDNQRPRRHEQKAVFLIALPRDLATLEAFGLKK